MIDGLGADDLALKKGRSATLPISNRNSERYEPKLLEPKLLEHSPQQPGRNRYVVQQELLPKHGRGYVQGGRGGEKSNPIELFESNSLDDIIETERGPEPLPPQAQSSVVETPIYDTAAVKRAFGPLRDVGRWYSHEQERRRVRQQQMRSSRYTHPCPLPSGNVHRTSNAGTGTGTDYYTYEGQDEVVYTRVGPCFDPNPAQAQSLAYGLKNLAFQGWYWGPLTRQEAEEKLDGTPDGTFLVRDSSDDRYLLSLSFRSQGRTLHTRIEFYNSKFSFYQRSDTEGHATVVELIEKSVDDSRDGILCYSRGRGQTAPAYPVRLTQSLSRFNRVRSLQHHCRFVIRQLTRFDLIRQLPLPNGMKDYLEGMRF
jgi:suppressor of cytokine signaling 7